MKNSKRNYMRQDMTDKIKISKQEFDENYEVQDTKDLPGTTEVKVDETPKDVEDTIPQSEIDADNLIEQEMFPEEKKDGE